MCEMISNTVPTRDDQLRRILLAEDDDAMRTFLANTLRRMGFTVQEISSAKEMETYLADTEERMKRSPFLGADLIITAISMPGRTVLDMLREIRKRIDHTPIVLITTLEDTTTHAMALSLGATAVFDKPFNIDALKAFLRNAVGHPSTAPLIHDESSL